MKTIILIATLFITQSFAAEVGTLLKERVSNEPVYGPVYKMDSSDKDSCVKQHFSLIGASVICCPYKPIKERVSKKLARTVWEKAQRYGSCSLESGYYPTDIAVCGSQGCRNVMNENDVYLALKDLGCDQPFASNEAIMVKGEVLSLYQGENTRAGGNIICQ